jgi:DNA-binding LacI/PurR family transcriptional regulator
LTRGKRGKGAIFVKRATIVDVAVRAGVSKSTVSHALSGKRPISAKTRQRIHEAIEELGYRPNPVAQRLATGQKSRTVAFVFPLLAPNIAGLEMKFISGSANTINRAGYAFLLLTHLDHRHMDSLEQFAQSGLVDGFILMQVQLHDPRVELLQHLKTPFVLVGRCADNTNLFYVDANIELAIRQCVEHLTGLGHQTLAYLHQDSRDFGFMVRALDNFAAACHSFGVRPLTRSCTLSPDNGEAAINKLLEQHPDVTAVIVWNDTATLGVVQGAQARGLHIPDDLSIICFDYSTISNLIPFRPTVVDIRGELIAAQAAEMMIDLIEHRSIEASQVLIGPRFIQGDSTAPARK